MNWRRPTIPALLGPLATVFVLAGLAWSIEQREPSADMVAVQDRVREAAESFPDLIDGWYGRRVEIPAPAVHILKPNALISRRYRHAGSGETVKLLLVHTRDAVDLVHHYPPVCYPNNGWEPVWSERRRWVGAERHVPLREYCFERGGFDDKRRIVVTNFMVSAAGLHPGMEPVRRIANAPSRRFFGAAQFQLIFDASISRKRRREVFRTLVGACRPVIDTLVQGESP